MIIMKLNQVFLFLFLISCSFGQKKEFYLQEIGVNDCLYYNRQRIFILDERDQEQWVLFSEINNMKYVFVEHKSKVRNFAVKVKCEPNRKEEVYKILENQF